MRRYKIFLFSLVAPVVLFSCDLLEPADDNHSTIKRVYEDPSFGEGLLIRAYAFIPTNNYRYDEVATDDAVSNDRQNSYMRIATGEWSALYNPQSLWDNCNQGILYANKFLDVVDSIPWKWTDDDLNALYVRRLTGESYALRGLFKYFLLRNHGGYGSNGELLGTPIYDKFLETKEEFSTPRAVLSDFVSSAKSDFDKALTYLPLDYGNLGSVDELPAGFAGVSDISLYNTVFGDVTQQRMSGRHVEAMKARFSLLAATPAFNASNNTSLWSEAADKKADLMDDIGGPAGLDPKGHNFFL
ncbi:MAG: RagB/SusD family nutrient uptake outer membrane protein [Draconibacterium sp.]